jgi:hypothetical protein
VAACSDPTSLGVLNTCAFPVEVQNPRLAAGGWTPIGVGERVSDLEGGSDALDLVVRRGPDGPSMSMSVPAADIDELTPGPFGPEILLTDPICGLLGG